MKRVLAFDLDGTLAPSKSRMAPDMAAELADVLNTYQICVISGGKFEQFDTQILQAMPDDATALARLHLMPTCGTQYYRYDAGWKQVYAENFMPEEKDQIIAALKSGVHELGLAEPTTYGEIIEDRGSQITFSALGQDIVDELGEEGVALKEAWDPDGAKKERLRQYVTDLIPGFEVRAGGTTSIDITKPGIDKAYGMNKLIELLGITKDDILFFGDKLQPGGNDYPVKAMGIDSIEVSDWRDTLAKLKAL